MEAAAQDIEQAETVERRGPSPRLNKTQRDLRDQEEQSLKEMIDELSPDVPVRVRITRIKPIVGPNGENVGGSLENVEDRIDEDYIREMWGGGTFEVRIHRQDQKGSFQYYKARRVQLAGEPKMHGKILVPGAPVAAVADGAGGLAERAFETMERNMKRAQERLEDAEQSRGGIDAATIAAFTAPLQAALDKSHEQIIALQQQVTTLLAAPPPRDEFRDRLMEKAVSGSDERVASLRDVYEQRLEKLRDNHQDEIKRIREHHEKQIERLEDRHEREIKSLEDRHERELKSAEKAANSTEGSTKIAFDARVDSLKDTISRLEREIIAKDAELGTLRAKKDKSMVEQAKEMRELKETFDDVLGSDKDDDAEKPWYERAITALGEAPAVLDLIGKIGGGKDQLPPPGQQFYGPDGGVYMRQPDGSVVMIAPPQQAQLPARQGKKRRRIATPEEVAAGAGQAAIEGAEEGGDEAALPAPQIRQPTQTEIAQAVAFMENAVKANADPEVFARGARNLVPGELLQWIQHVGPEKFLSSLKMAPGDPLTTVAGRTFVRKAFKHLFEGGSE